MNANGTGVTQITNDANDIVSPQGLTWSPDSTKLTYLGGAGSRICNADGSGIQNLPVAMHQMQWSPDGTKFVYSAFQQARLLPSGNYENIWQIYTVNVDGSGLTQLSTGPDSYGSPCWSHDGTKILFVDILTTSTTNMYLMNCDGSNCTLVPGV